MTVIVYGSSGALGKTISSRLEDNGFDVLKLSTREGVPSTIYMDANGEWVGNVKNTSDPHSVVFAQGLNINDDIFDLSHFNRILEANVFFILQEVSNLLSKNVIKNGSSIVILSSVWQDFSRRHKLSYTVSKSAIRGIINSLVADLGSLGIRVNAVSPGVVDTPMTREMLEPGTIQRIVDETPLGYLVTDDNIAEVVLWLTSNKSSGVVGQFITVDNGWTNVRLIP
jgi:NAD(P)-dependent dehydrogenase (short-subunit alcohol dehydrogenase family)